MEELEKIRREKKEKRESLYSCGATPEYYLSVKTGWEINLGPLLDYSVWGDKKDVDYEFQQGIKFIVDLFAQANLADDGRWDFAQSYKNEYQDLLYLLYRIKDGMRVIRDPLEVSKPDAAS